MILLTAFPAAALAWWSAPAALGVLLAAAPTYLVRTEVLGVPTTLLEALVLGVVAGAALRMVAERRRPVGFGPLTLPVLALVAVWLASALLSADTRAGLGALKAWLVEPLLVALVAVNVLRSERARWIAAGGALLGTAALSLYGIVEKVLGSGLPTDGRLNSVFEPANYHAMLVAPIAAFALPWLRARGRTRWIAVGSLAVNGVALVLTESYGGLGALAVAVLVWLTFLPRPARRAGFVAFALAALLALLPQLGTEKFQLLGRLGERSSSSVRVQIWRSTLDIIGDHPVLGVGPNAFEAPYREAAAKRFWPPLEWLVAQPHNLYLAVAAEAGLLGLAAFVWLLVVWGRTVLRPIRTLTERPWALASALALTAVLIHGLVDTPVLKNDLALLLAVVLALPFTGTGIAGTKTPPLRAGVS